MEKNNLIQRQLLNKLRDRAVEIGFNPQDVRPHTLKVYAELKKNQKGLVFVIEQTNKGGVCDTENLLAKSDVFYANAFGLGIHQVKLDATQKPMPGNSPLIFYPDPDLFVGAAVAGGVLPEADCLEMLYNSNLSLQTDQDIRLDKFSTNIFRIVPQTQFAGTPRNQPNYDGLATVDISTAIALFGDRVNSVKIDFPDGDYSAIEGNIVNSGYKNFAVLVLEGFSIVGGANNARVVDLINMR